MANMIPVLVSNNGYDLIAEVPEGADIGHLRTLTALLERSGAPSSFTFAVNAVGVEDSYKLQPNDKVSYRAKDGTKGARKRNA